MVRTGLTAVTMTMSFGTYLSTSKAARSAVWLGLALALVLAVAPVSAADWRFGEVDRIVAISDVHGAYPAMVRTLEAAGILDESLAWAGGESRLVVTGDLLDRGPASRQAMDLLMRLETEAAAGAQLQVKCLLEAVATGVIQDPVEVFRVAALAGERPERGLDADRQQGIVGE
jgi:hypothetical protein